MTLTPFGTVYKHGEHHDTRPCQVGHIAKCGKPRWGWTNFMEPICKEHFQQRRFVQNLMVLVSCRGSWAALVVAANPEGFKPH